MLSFLSRLWRRVFKPRPSEVVTTASLVEVASRASEIADQAQEAIAQNFENQLSEYYVQDDGVLKARTVSLSKSDGDTVEIPLSAIVPPRCLQVETLEIRLALDVQNPERILEQARRIHHNKKIEFINRTLPGISGATVVVRLSVGTIPPILQKVIDQLPNLPIEELGSGKPSNKTNESSPTCNHTMEKT